MTPKSELSGVRRRLQPIITKYSKTIDYYSEQYMRTGDVNFLLFYEHNKKAICELKEYIVNEEEKLRLSSGSDGGLQ